ncbi:MAG TPA: hypothetical protein VGF15_00140 [Solirubrobacteraceae bacterium]
MAHASSRTQGSTALSANDERFRTTAVQRPEAARARAWAGVLGLIGVLVGTFGVAAGAASAPTMYVPGRLGGWTGWLAGPLSGLGVGLDSTSFQLFTLIMCAGYALVLIGAPALHWPALAGTIVAAHVLLVLGPPLISQDVFGYLAFARLGVLHGLDPYTHVAAQIAGDPIFNYQGWAFQHSPYGPLFTLGSYAITPLGLAGGLWTLKLLAMLASLGAIALTARAAAKMGRSPLSAAAFVGLNPVLLELAVGGDHNDTLIMLALAGALVLTAGANPRLRAGAGALVAGVGVKVTAGLVLAFLVLSPADWRRRLTIGSSAAASLALLAIIALVGFGSHALGFIGAISDQQQMVATHSIPAETARLLGLAGTPIWWRHVFLGLFLVVLGYALWRTARGADWRAAAGWSTLALVCCTAWLLPWYAIWVLPLTALSRDRRLYVATLLFCAYAMLIHLPLADGLLSPPRH